MKARNIVTLVVKDLRMSRRVVAVSLFVWALPMMLAAVVAIVANTRYGRSYAMDMMLLAGSWSFFLAYLVIPTVVGHLLAAEGTDRSAGFLAYMPFSRIESLAGKVISATMMTALFVGLNVLLATILFVLEPATVRPPTLEFMPVFLSAMVAIFGGTWMAAICLRSAAIATVVGLAVPLSLYVYQIAYYEGVWQRMFIPWSLGLGVAFFIIGVVVFMKRKPEA